MDDRGVDCSSLREREGVIVQTRTSVGRSHYDFAMQNRTVKEYKKRFGGTTYKDGGNGDGYDPGPPVPPPASGCTIAMNRLDWNLSRINMYLFHRKPLEVHQSMVAMEKISPGLKEINPEVFSCNMLVPYIISLMEDYFKSTYVALLRYSGKKEAVLKGLRIRGDQLASISAGKLTVEEAFAELLPFHLPSNVGQHFSAVDKKLDILAPLRRVTKRKKTSLLERVDGLVKQRHELIHDMRIDVSLDHRRIEEILFDVTDAMARIYRQITSHYGWPYELPMSSNFSSRRSWEKARKARASLRGEKGQSESLDT